MKNKFIHGIGLQPNISLYAYVICASFLICGCIVGTFVSGLVNDGKELFDYISSYLKLIESGQSDTDFFTEFLRNMKYHTMVLLLGFSVFGAPVIPVILGIRGFTLSFSVSSMVRVLGGRGIVLALSAFGVSAVFIIPSLIIFGAHCTRASSMLFLSVFKRNLKQDHMIYDKAFLIRALSSFAFIAVISVFDRYISGLLLNLII